MEEGTLSSWVTHNWSSESWQIHNKDRDILSIQAIHLAFYSVQSLSLVWLFVTPWSAASQASLSITNFQSFLKLVFIVLVMPSNHLILCCPVLLLLFITLPNSMVSGHSNHSLLWAELCPSHIETLASVWRSDRDFEEVVKWWMEFCSDWIGTLLAEEETP